MGCMQSNNYDIIVGYYEGVLDSDFKHNDALELYSDWVHDESHDLMTSAFSDPYGIVLKWSVDGCDPAPSTKQEGVARYTAQTKQLASYAMTLYSETGIIVVARGSTASGGVGGSSASSPSARGPVVGVMLLQPPGVDLDKKTYYKMLYKKLGTMPCTKFKKEWGPLPEQRLTSMTKVSKARKKGMKAAGFEKYWTVTYFGSTKDAHVERSKMIRALVKVADAEDLAVCVECVSPQNETFFKGFGFETKETVSIGAKADEKKRTQLFVFMMVRPPKSDTMVY